MKRTMLFRVDANNDIGIGHLRRCLVLAKCFYRKGYQVFFVLGIFSNAAEKLLQCAGYPYVVIEDKLAERQFLLELNAKEEVSLIIDISHGENFLPDAGVKEYINFLIDKNMQFVLFDGLGQDSLIKQQKLFVPCVIAPYVGAEQHFTSEEAEVALCGAGYFVFDESYGQLKRKKFNDDARNILITFGGSDPFDMTVFVLASLASLKSECVFRVIIGSLCTNEIENKILSVVEASALKIEVVKAPNGLLEHLLWADIGLTSTGLSKYEFAYAGVPSLLISSSEKFASINQSFAEVGCSMHLGIMNKMSKQTVFDSFVRLLEGQELRRQMVQKGKALFQNERLVVNAIEHQFAERAAG